MDVEQIFFGLNHTEKIQVLDLTLPGIEAFLKNVLSREQLSEESEHIRRRYVKILENSTCPTNEQPREAFVSLKENDLGPLQTPPITESCFSYTHEAITQNSNTLLNDEDLVKTAFDAKASVSPRQDRKGTDSTEESGVFFSTQFVPSGSQEFLNPRHSDTFESTSSRDTFVSDSEFEFLEWESDINAVEDGYSTEDNMDNILQNVNLDPDQLGGIYSGVLYIREQPGWHKRWFSLTERCMKCYKHRTDEQMLFEIPLRDAKFVFTDRKRTKMFPITLSIARLKDNITFASTEEQNRHEWMYVINHVIKKLAEEEPYPKSSSENKNISSLQLRSEGVEECSTRGPERVQNSTAGNALEVSSESLKCKTWHTGGVLDDVLNDWRPGGDDETADMDSSLSASLAQGESFKELQECLPDILQRPKSRSWRGDIHFTPERDTSAARRIPSRKNIAFNMDVESRLSSSSENVPKVKRHGSLANSLSNKAARVRSKLTTSFFKKGKRDDKMYYDGGSQPATFSGYLLRKKGNTWKNRWCVVNDRSLYCYKEFGAGLAELELTLVGCGVAVPEGPGERPFMFVLSTGKEQLQFSAENDAEMEEWIVVLEKEASSLSKVQDDAINIYPIDFVDGHALTTLSSPDSPQPYRESQSEIKRDVENKETAKRSNISLKTKKEISTSQTLLKKSSLLGAIAHKLGKHSSKTTKADVSTRLVSNDECNDGVLQPRDEVTVESEADLSGKSQSMSGFLGQRCGDKWLRCKTTLHNHTIEVEPQYDGAAVGKTAFKLIDCIVLDCTDTEGPLVMVIEPSTGQPLYLKAENEQDYVAWKDAILAAVLTTPTTRERLLSSESETDHDDTLNSAKISGDSFDSEDVYLKRQESQSNSVVEAHPSPRPSIAGDISSEESADEFHSAPPFRLTRACSAGGIDRLRSLSEGYLVHSNKRQSPLRRTISNALSSLDLSPKKARSKTFSGLGVNASLLVGIKYTSCIHVRIQGLWSKRWCVLQQNKLHFFTSPDDVTPALSIHLKNCLVQKTNIKGKRFTFVLKVPSGQLEHFLAAESEQELIKWTDLLKEEASLKEEKNDGKRMEFDLLGGVFPKMRGQSYIAGTSRPDVAVVNEKDNAKNQRKIRKFSTSLVELRKIRQAAKDELDVDVDNGPSSSSLISHKPTSLQEVLLLLQEQQMMQSMGHQRFIRVKKARGNWKKTAAAVLNDTNSLPESPELLKKNQEDREITERKPRCISAGSTHSTDLAGVLSSCQSSEDYLGKCNKLAGEEKLKALKTETLLRKRRNSLSLEKEVLEKKLGKPQEKKSAVKKRLGKEIIKDKEEFIRTQKRLEEINLKLSHVDQDMQQNKNKEAAVMENITALKTRSARKYSGESGKYPGVPETKSAHDDRRLKYRESPTGSTSSRDSFDERPGRSYPERTASLHRKSSKKACQASLVALEKKLHNISPNVQPRKKKYGSLKSRVSSSSEGSVDDTLLLGSPSAPVHCLHEKPCGLDNNELNRKTPSDPLENHEVAMSIPTETSIDEHRPGLITALSQIKDFEEFLEINRRR